MAANKAYNNTVTIYSAPPPGEHSMKSFDLAVLKDQIPEIVFELQKDDGPIHTFQSYSELEGWVSESLDSELRDYWSASRYSSVIEMMNEWMTTQMEEFLNAYDYTLTRKILK